MKSVFAVIVLIGILVVAFGSPVAPVRVPPSERPFASVAVTCAPEMPRMTLNIARAHTDAAASPHGKRLVYGGHTISLAFAQLVRAFPNALNLVAWQGCDHLGPVLEQDLIRSEVKVISALPVETGGRLVTVDIASYARRPNDAGDYEEKPVLDWRLVIWDI